MALFYSLRHFGRLWRNSIKTRWSRVCWSIFSHMTNWCFFGSLRKNRSLTGKKQWVRGGPPHPVASTAGELRARDQDVDALRSKVSDLQSRLSASEEELGRKGEEGSKAVAELEEKVGFVVTVTIYNLDVFDEKKRKGFWFMKKKVLFLMKSTSGVIVLSCFICFPYSFPLC